MGVWAVLKITFKRIVIFDYIQQIQFSFFLFFFFCSFLNLKTCWFLGSKNQIMVRNVCNWQQCIIKLKTKTNLYFFSAYICHIHYWMSHSLLYFMWCKLKLFENFWCKAFTVRNGIVKTNTCPCLIEFTKEIELNLNQLWISKKICNNMLQ